MPRNLYMKWLPDHLFGARVYPQADSRATSARLVSTLALDEKPASANCKYGGSAGDDATERQSSKRAIRVPPNANSAMANGSREHCAGEPLPVASSELDLVPLKELGPKPSRSTTECENVSLDTGYGSVCLLGHPERYKYIIQ